MDVLARWLLLSLLCLGWCGCAAEPSGRASRLKPSVLPAGQDHLMMSEPNDPIVAQVNGRPIRHSTVASVLWQGRARAILDELVLLEVVRRQAAEAGIVASAELIGDELGRILQDMAPDRSAQQQTALLDYLLKSRGMTRAEFDLLVERRALLRQLVDPNVAITNDMLELQYQRQHGRRVLVRQVTATNLREIETVRRRLKEGADFIELARRMSQDQATLERDGLLGPFSKADEQVPEPIRQAGLQLAEPGERSGIISYRDDQGRRRWCLLQLEQALSPDEVSLADVRGELLQDLREKTIRQRMSELQRQLMDQAQIMVLDPVLREADGR